MHFTALKHLYPESHILVCGRGPSIADAYKYTSRADRIITCNDTDCGVQPSFRLIADPPDGFKSEGRLEGITNKYLPYIVSGYRGWSELISPQHYIHYPMISRGGRPFDQLYTHLFTSMSSSFAACCLAAVLGAVHISLIGVDLNTLNFIKWLPTINRDFKDLTTFLHSRQISIVNLSQNSLLTSIPKLSRSTL